MTKVCSICKQEKNLSEFYKDKNRKGGYYCYCKECSHKMQREYYKTEEGKENILRSNKQYRNSKEGKKKKREWCRSEEGQVSIKKSRIKLRNSDYYIFGRGGVKVLREASKKRNHNFNLTPEQLETWWKSKEDICHYCGTTVEEYIFLRDFIIEYKDTNSNIKRFKQALSGGFGKANRLTIDRLNNSKGYETPNMVKACWFCNFIKGQIMTPEETSSVVLPMMIKLKEDVNMEVKNE